MWIRKPNKTMTACAFALNYTQSPGYKCLRNRVQCIYVHTAKLILKWYIQWIKYFINILQVAFLLRLW